MTGSVSGNLERRHISLQFQLGLGDFGEAGVDVFKVSGLRVQAAIKKSGGLSLSECQLRVYGLPLSVMNKLSILGKSIQAARVNTVTVLAGSDSSGLQVAFQGIIYESWIDGRDAPNISLVITARTGALAAMKPVPTTSYSGTVDAATVAAGIANQLGLKFVNSGVQTVFADPYFHGTFFDQLMLLKQMARCHVHIEGEQPDGTLEIWPLDGTRGGSIPVISKDTGLSGYPELAENGINIQTLFNPSLQVGGSFYLESIIDRASGKWTAYAVAHDLESETDNGKWFTTTSGSLFGAVLAKGPG